MSRAGVIISPGAVFIWALLFYLDNGNLVPHFLAAAVFHEMGHFAAIHMLKGQVSNVKIGVLGAEISMASNLLPYGSEIICALAGPAVNIVLAVFSGAAAEIVRMDELYVFAGVNAALAALNLLPARALDGGRAVSFALKRHMPYELADSISFILSLLSCVLIFAGGVIMGCNLTLIGIALFLAVKSVK